MPITPAGAVNHPPFKREIRPFFAPYHREREQSAKGRQPSKIPPGAPDKIHPVPFGLG